MLRTLIHLFKPDPPSFSWSWLDFVNYKAYVIVRLSCQRQQSVLSSNLSLERIGERRGVTERPIQSETEVVN